MNRKAMLVLLAALAALQVAAAAEDKDNPTAKPMIKGLSLCHGALPFLSHGDCMLVV